MGDFDWWLGNAPDTPVTAFTAHWRLVKIHRFNDGNGRKARPVMNLVLIRGAYPPVAIRPEDRAAYVQALHRQRDDEGQDLDRLL